MSEIGLVASRFERFAATVGDDIDVELLLYPEHLETPEFVADATDAVVAEIDRLFGEADTLGIPYPLSALSLVEVPSRLRGYRGGWRLETALAMPGVLMVKEHGLPTARFGGPLYELSASEQDDPARGKVLDLWVHTSNDVVGGADVHRGFAHNLFRAVARASGPGADALDFVCFELAVRLLTQENLASGRHFSAHRFDNDAYFGAVFGRAAQAMAAGHFGPLILFSPYVQRHSVWTLASSTSLAELERHNAPRLAEDAMLLRAAFVAQAMYDGLGRAGAGAVLDRWGYLTRGSGPIRIPGMTSKEVGLVLPEPPDQLWLHPYGSLNRNAIRIQVPLDIDTTDSLDQDAFVGTRPSDWVPGKSGIVVDDLDNGFTAIGSSLGIRVSALRRMVRYWEIDIDQGLPAMERRHGEWIRREVPSARGKYRHTAALVRAGDGEEQVAFEAHLDGPGRWQLEYHIPNRHLPPPRADPKTSRRLSSTRSAAWTCVLKAAAWKQR